MNHIMTIASRHVHSVSHDYVRERLHELQFAVGVVVTLGGAVVLLGEFIRRLA